ncbi:Z1 domain-containing protein [Novosphingobium sp. THN1]|uniref:Z1 domain-containing protein n=1 Tax=Novosphingobium sp. THN1 TaxID=1016987 RepID=UPI001F085E9A|nr:Z1 domain-containing protein [Novosphingobium sp. THN1]
MFVLARAIRVLRGDGAKHCSMMINVSRFNDIQDYVHGLTYTYQKQLDDAIKVNAGLGAAGLRDPDMAALKVSFDKEFSACEFSFDEVQKALNEASRTIVVRTVNMRGGVLDYEANKTRGLHVIAIGGLALSRGLTLEGLTVSYILRNSAASDTLMQMARWFGYRRNYEDICRLYICQTSVDHYEYIEDAVEELRGELKRMELRNETPEQFGLKVRRSDTGILITAANKMRNARTLQLVQSFSEKHVEGYALHNDKAINSANLAEVGRFMVGLGDPQRPGPAGDKALNKDISKHLTWTGISGKQVFELLRKFQFHSAQPSLGLIDGKNSLFSDYVSDRLSDELRLWDVVIPLNAGRDPDAAGPKTAEDMAALPLRGRNKGLVKPMPGGATFKPMGDKNRISDPNEDPPMLLQQSRRDEAVQLRADGQFKGDRAFCHVRDRPLLMVHLFKVHKPVKDLELADVPIASLSFQMPKSSIQAVPKSYEVNSVYRRQLEAMASEPEDDEALLDE